MKQPEDFADIWNEVENSELISCAILNQACRIKVNFAFEINHLPKREAFGLKIFGLGVTLEKLLDLA